jgi:hypothetical protein
MEYVKEGIEKTLGREFELVLVRDVRGLLRSRIVSLSRSSRPVAAAGTRAGGGAAIEME